MSKRELSARHPGRVHPAAECTAHSRTALPTEEGLPQGAAPANPCGHPLQLLHRLLHGGAFGCCTIEGVREGTIIAALIVGLFARFFNRRLQFVNKLITFAPDKTYSTYEDNRNQRTRRD